MAARALSAGKLFQEDIRAQIVRNSAAAGDAGGGLCAGLHLHLCCNPWGGGGGSSNAKGELVRCAVTALTIVAFFAFVIAYAVGSNESQAATQCREARENLDDVDGLEPNAYNTLAWKLKVQHYAHNINTLCAAVAAIGAALLLTAAIIALCSLEYNIAFNPVDLAIYGGGVVGGATVIGMAAHSYASYEKMSTVRYDNVLKNLQVDGA